MKIHFFLFRYFSLVDARTQQITFTKNTPLSSYVDNKPKPKPRPLIVKKPASFYKPRLQKVKPKVSKIKDKTIKMKPKKITQLKHNDDQSKGKPLPVQDYAKLTKMLQMLSKWQQPHKLKHVSKVAKVKPMLSYKELRKVLEDMTPDIVKKIANQIIAHDRNRTRLGDMKPLSAEKSLEVHLASKLANSKDAGFKRVKVSSSTYKNWSKKGNSSTAPKVRNKHEDVVLEEDAKPVKLNKNGAAAKALQKNTSEQIGTGDKEVQDNLETTGNQSPSENNTLRGETEESLRYSTQRVSNVQTADGNKIPRLPSFIPTADKRRKYRLKHKPKQSLHSLSQQDGSKQPQSHKDDLKSDVQSNKRTFVNFIVTETDDKKRKLSKAKSDSLRKNTHFNETENSVEANISNFQEKAKALEKTSVKSETKQNGTGQENQTAIEAVSSTSAVEPTEEVDEVFDTNVKSKNTTFEKEVKDTKKTDVKPSDSTPVEKALNKTKKTGVKHSNNTLIQKAIKVAKKKITHPLILLKYPGMPHKILHVEAKWNGQIKVKANWKDEAETVPKTKKTSSVKKNKVKPKKKTSKKMEGNSGDDEGSDENKFDDSGARNDLVWMHNRPLKDKIH